MSPIYDDSCFGLFPQVKTFKNDFVADDFGYVCLDKGKRELVNVVDTSKHNAETSHAQRLRQQWRWRTHYGALVQGTEWHW